MAAKANYCIHVMALATLAVYEYITCLISKHVVDMGVDQNQSGDI